MNTDGMLLSLNPRDYEGMDGTTQKAILALLRRAGAYWTYQGDPSSQKPHAQLASGLCSNGYFDCPQLLSYPNIAEILGRSLARFLVLQGHIGSVDWVVSSAYSAITFGHEVARALRARFMNTEKDPADPKRQLWQRLVLPRGARVLQVEELITTWQTSAAVRQAIEQGNPEEVEFLPIVGTLVLRPPDLNAMKQEHAIISLVETEIWALPPKNCPLHAAGSVALKPKTHWAELTGER